MKNENEACDIMAVLFIFLTVQAQRRSKEHSRSTSALSGLADEKSEVSQDADHHMSLYSNGFMASSIGNNAHPKTTNPIQHRTWRRGLCLRGCV